MKSEFGIWEFGQHTCMLGRCAARVAPASSLTLALKSSAPFAADGTLLLAHCIFRSCPLPRSRRVPHLCMRSRRGGCGAHLRLRTGSSRFACVVFSGCLRRARLRFAPADAACRSVSSLGACSGLGDYPGGGVVAATTGRRRVGIGRRLQLLRGGDPANQGIRRPAHPSSPFRRGCLLACLLAVRLAAPLIMLWARCVAAHLESLTFRQGPAVSPLASGAWCGSGMLATRDRMNQQSVA